VGTYASDPVPQLTDGTSYFDVATDPTSSFTTVTFEICGAAANASIDWWDPGTQAWEPASDQGAPSGQPPCIDVTVNGTTSPSTSQLGGTVFGLVSPPVMPAGTTTAITSNSAAEPYGAENLAAFTVTVTGQPGAGVPKGGVAVTTGVTAVCAASTPISTTADSATFRCSPSTPSLLAVAASAYPVSASFTPATDSSSNPNYAYTGSSTTVPVSFTVTSNGAPTTTALVLSASTVTYGAEQTEAFAATVSDGGTVPKGTVAVQAGSATLCTITLSSPSGKCSLTAAQLAAGSYSVIAVFHPALSSYSPSTSTAHALVVNAAATTTTLNLSAPSATYGKENAQSFTVNVSAVGATPLGTVAVAQGATTLCTVTLSGGSGACALTATQLPAGTYSLKALYSPATPNFAASTASHAMAVLAAPTTSTLHVSTSPVTYGAETAEAFTVQVSGAGVVPAGTVTVQEGTTMLCSVTLSAGSGGCALGANQLAAGTYAVKAVYTPSAANVAGSASPAASLVVLPAGTALTPKAPVTTASGSSTTVTFGATLTSLVNGRPIAGQRVTFTLDGTGSPSCSAVTNASGMATCSVLMKTSVYLGATSYVAGYDGNTDFLSSQATEPA
jgi:hypothetical protein